MSRMRELEMARKVADLGPEPRRQKEKKPLPISKRLKREIMQATGGLEPDPVVRDLCPTIAHKLFGKTGPDGLSGGQRRQVRNFAVDVVKTLRLSGHIKTSG